MVAIRTVLSSTKDVDDLDPGFAQGGVGFDIAVIGEHRAGLADEVIAVNRSSSHLDEGPSE